MPRKPPKPWTLYCIAYAVGDRRYMTYVGVTVDLKQRLRRHNGIITGGAKYTTSIKTRFPGAGRRWRLLYTITGLNQKRLVLQWEWRLHRRTSLGRGCTKCNRIAALARTRAMDRVVSTAPRNKTLKYQVHWHGESKSCRAGTCKLASHTRNPKPPCPTVILSG